MAPRENGLSAAGRAVGESLREHMISTKADYHLTDTVVRAANGKRDWWGVSEAGLAD